MRRDLLFKYLNYFIQHLIFHKKNLCNFSFILHNTGRSKLTLFLGTIASFNWDTTSTSNLKTDLWSQFHLADQDYDICIRRTRGYCSVCYSPQIVPAITGAAAATTEGSSFGVGAASVPLATLTSATGTICTGVTSINAIAPAALGFGTVSTKF